MELGLKGKVVLVTGSGEGIGRRAILTFAEEGAHVIVNDIVLSRAEHVGDEARALGAKALVKIADVTDENQVKGMVKEILSEFGKIDILVNNAFVMDRKVFSQSTREDWDKPINVCLYGTLICTRAVIDSMIARKYGKIINLISDAARVGEATSSAYAAAKGVSLFQPEFGQEVGRYNINVNCVSPGATWTERRIREHQREWEEASEEERERIKRREEKQLRGLSSWAGLGNPKT